ncbi:pyridoxamine 5'-phosphate oxidase family protein [Paractinoplanes rishiriensis]|uniref:Pyridoxamine 5'-phosphate oxidase n=1 Tax=Paractinoplanes rishiriensis TaxID=1050105 RepID=A0A919K318_9ACTN|nr:pyridoxamine 5'-phosphate oxidase family protein [Actinoplanes rishiriensis]GIE99976.1 pyridoxamine 5'-phosphate oxidase [Actinoplanes rishiriensis]
MRKLTPTKTKNLDRYGNPALDWARAQEALSVPPGPEITFFLGTCRPDGTPHAAGIGALWLAGHLYFTSNLAARKARDLAANPRCTISVRLPGIDLVLEGTAAVESGPEVLEQVAAGYREGGWPCRAEGGALTAPFSAPSAGPPPWHVYRFTYITVVGVATEEPYGAAQWRFA